MMKRFLAVAGLGLALAGVGAFASAATPAPANAAAPTARPAAHAVPLPGDDSVLWSVPSGGKGKDGDSCKKQTDCAPGYACRKWVCRKA